VYQQDLNGGRSSEKASLDLSGCALPAAGEHRNARWGRNSAVGGVISQSAEPPEGGTGGQAFAPRSGFSVGNPAPAGCGPIGDRGQIDPCRLPSNPDSTGFHHDEVRPSERARKAAESSKRHAICNGFRRDTSNLRPARSRCRGFSAQLEPHGAAVAAQFGCQPRTERQMPRRSPVAFQQTMLS